MASLRLPRLCCPLRDGGTELLLTSPVYQTICGCCAVLGLLGVALSYLPTKSPVQSRPNGARIQLASSMITTGLLVNAVLWLSLPEFLTNQSERLPHILCVIITTWIHYFTSLLFWSFFCYFLELALLLGPNPTERWGKFLAFLCWGASGLVLLHGLLMIVPADNRCDSSHGLVVLHDVSLYLPFLLALFGSPILLRRAINRVSSVLKMHCGVYTSSERLRKRSLCRRLVGICGVFIGCWFGNVLCDVVLLLVEVWGAPQAPRQVLATARILYVIMGILNPVFCCVHSLAFYGWRSSAAPGVQQCGGAALDGARHVTSEDNGEEAHGLLTCGAPASGKLSVPNILQLMDSYSSMEFRCSALEINAVRLLGTRDTKAPAAAPGSELKARHSDV